MSQTAVVSSNIRRIAHLDLSGDGFRIADVRTPTISEEIGDFIPEPVNGEARPQSNDVDVDARGLVYLMDRNTDFDILEFDR